MRRISSFSKVWLGGNNDLSNWARLYKVSSTSLTAQAEKFYYAVDPFTGYKIRKPGGWLDV